MRRITCTRKEQERKKEERKKEIENEKRVFLLQHISGFNVTLKENENNLF